MVVNDWPGLGKAAASINIPILNAAGYEVAFLPTLLLSTHTGYEGFQVRSMGSSFMAFAEHWRQQDVSYPAIVSGYFESAAQINDFVGYLSKIRQDQAQDALVIADPIMAEGGALYPGFTQEIVEGMRRLVGEADIILPNITEAYLLAGQAYQAHPDEAALTHLAVDLHQLGPATVVITGVRQGDQIGFFVSRRGQAPVYILHAHFETEYCGTGDTAMSLMVAFLLGGHDLEQSLALTSQLLEEAMAVSYQQQRTVNMGINFEQILPRIHDLM